MLSLYTTNEVKSWNTASVCAREEYSQRCVVYKTMTRWTREKKRFTQFSSIKFTLIGVIFRLFCSSLFLPISLSLSFTLSLNHPPLVFSFFLSHCRSICLSFSFFLLLHCSLYLNAHSKWTRRKKSDADGSVEFAEVKTISTNCFYASKIATEKKCLAFVIDIEKKNPH